MRYFLLACTAVAALTGVADYRYISAVRAVYTINRQAFAETLHEGITGDDPRMAHRLRGLDIVPGAHAGQLSLALDVRLIDFFGGPDGWYTARLTVDVDTSIYGRSLIFERPCLRTAEHDIDVPMGPGVEARVLETAIRHVLGGHRSIRLPAEAFERGKAYRFKRRLGHAAVGDESVRLSIGLRDSRRPAPSSPVGGECASGG
ncbi:hypothetical protein [Arhodomonas sp. AD133]|uniref:hypothetical protein n=1 Tax=Arhodomonas sp. AD133 TaxID=3415009 RepID=UPI003EB83A02